MGSKNKEKKTLAQSPPPADPSSDDEYPTATSSDRVDSSSSDDDEVNHHTSAIKTPVAAAPQPSDDSSDEDEYSDEESDDDVVRDTKPTPTPTPKPNSKPVASSTKPKPKPGTTVAGLPSASAAKRPAQNDATKPPSEKKAKKEKSNTPAPAPAAATTAVETTAATPQKKLFERLWSEEDEMQILKGMIEYKVKRGSDPMGNLDDFFLFIKKSINVPDVKKKQMVDKVRRLKKKFHNAEKKSRITNPKELAAFELGKKIWGGDPTPMVTDSKPNGVTVAFTVEEEGDDEEEEEEEVEVEEEKKKKVEETNKMIEKKGGNVSVSVVKGFGEDELIGVELGFSEVNNAMVKGVMAVMEAGEREEMKRKIKKANEAALEAYMLRMEVLQVAGSKYLDDSRSK